MITLDTLVQYLNHLLNIEQFQDYCPNGLQVEGKPQIKKIISGVTACQALLEVAVKENADAILVHHGYFWKNEDDCVVGIKHHRLKTLLTHDISLLCYHLPLDAHREFGNNEQLAKELEFDIEHVFDVGGGMEIGFMGHLPRAMSGSELATHIQQKLERPPLHISGGDQSFSKIAWCTGGAQDFIDLAIKQGAQAYLTGEVSERTVHVARENGIHFYGAGHHATERYGVKALGDHIAKHFEIEHLFIDIDNPV